jgi:GT2 family glycosyltransferase
LLSLVVPTRNRAPLLGRALEAVGRHADPALLTDVIVVDNGSNDETPAVFRAAQARHPRHPWRYVQEPMPGLLSGRHRGASEARGDVLCYLDDDAVVDAGWCEAVRAGFADASVSLVGGPSRPIFEGRPPRWLRHLWRDVDGVHMLDSLSLIDCGPEPRLVEPWFVWGLNFSIRRQALHECGGFHPDGMPSHLLRYRGDGEGGLAYKIAERGLRTMYQPRALVLHALPPDRLTLAALERRSFAQGISDSYTAIRKAGAVPDGAAEPASAGRRLMRRAAVALFGSPRALHRLLASARAAGVRFHREQVRREAALLDWVLRPDYFDYALPAGWNA